VEPLMQAILDDIKIANDELRKAIDGLTAEALNWSPASDDANSLFVLATHMIGAQRFTVSVAAGLITERDRSSEFMAQGVSSSPLLQALRKAELDEEGWLSSIQMESLALPRSLAGRDLTTAGCLTLILRHMGEHAGHASLTRQLLDDR